VTSYKRLLIITLLFMLAALPAQAFACSFAPSAVNIHCRTRSDLVGKKICIGGNCSATFERESGGARLTGSPLKDSIYSNDSYGIFFYADRTTLIADAVLVIEQICTEDLSAIRPQFIQAIEAWRMKEKDALRDGDLVLTTYSVVEEKRLTQDRYSYGSCHYAEFERLGDWLLSTETSRSYCVITRKLVFPCPIIEISSVQFLGFLLTHISRETLPYLAAYLLGIVLLVGMLIFVYRRGTLRQFRPNVWAILGALAGGIALAGIWGFNNFFVYLAILYILVCFIRGMLAPKPNIG
jgi:hypothetical protein